MVARIANEEHSKLLGMVYMEWKILGAYFQKDTLPQERDTLRTALRCYRRYGLTL